MTARITAALALAAAAMLAALVAKVIAASVLAGTLLACVVVGLIVLYTAYRLIATGPGQRCAPRGWADEDDEDSAATSDDVTTAVIPRAATEHAPPWEYEAPPQPSGPLPEPIALWNAATAPEPEPVIEPAAVTSGPPERDVPATWVMTAYRTPDGRITSLEVVTGDETAPAWYGSAARTDAKIRTGMGVLPPWVADELGHDSTDDAVASMWNRAQALVLRERLADGAG